MVTDLFGHSTILKIGYPAASRQKTKTTLTAKSLIEVLE